VKSSWEDLHRYLDGEMEPLEAERFRVRLATSPELRGQLVELERVGAELRTWADAVGRRAEHLATPTLARVRGAEQKRASQATLVYALAAALVLGVPWARGSEGQAFEHLAGPKTRGAAIERIESGGKAQVFVLGSASTPVVWLSDDVDDDATEARGPG
jgi:anti-sigma factor RsiW